MKLRHVIIIIASILILFSCKAKGGTAPLQNQDSGAQTAVTTENGSTTDTSAAGGAGQQTVTSGAASGTTTTSDTTGTGTESTQPSAQTGTSSTTQTPSQQDSAPRRKVGEIAFYEGTVTVARKGATVKIVQIGDVVYTFDVVTTGPKSRMEIDLASGTPGGGTIKLTENTSFYFDTKVLDNGARKTVIQLLAGSLQVKVDKLANGSFNIATDAATLGVRGTLFIVDTIPDGTMMVTCAEGTVAVETEDGNEVKATANSAVVIQDGEAVKKQLDSASVSSYRNDWRKTMYDAFASKALSYTSMYAGIVDTQSAKLTAALQKLRAQQAILDLWTKDKAAGKEPSFTSYMTEKKTIAPALFEVLTALFAMERPYYRLVELKALHAGGIGAGTLKDGRSSATYFGEFDAKTQTLVTAMAEARDALRLFAWAAAGSPLGNFFGSKADSLGSGNLFFDEEF